jgi:hypothetical protein
MKNKIPTEVVNFRINADLIANLKKISSKISEQTGENYTYVDLIRYVLAEQFPVPSSDKIFEEQVVDATRLFSQSSKSTINLGVFNFPQVFISTTYNDVTSTQMYDHLLDEQ